jgi:opacity protein-like surface antigen
MSMPIRLAAAALLLFSAQAAFAFDEPPLVDAPELDTPIADIGYSFKTDSGDPSYRDFDTSTQTSTTKAFDNSRFAHDFSVGAGAGYQFNDFLRSDVTVDYFRTTHNATSDYDKCTPTTGKGAAGYCGYKGQKVSALSTLANGYVDLGTYWGLTPYAGAGGGISYVKWGNVRQSRKCLYTSSASDCSSVNFNGSTESGTDSWRFTYALMTGVSYDVSDKMKIDFGYRYTRIGEGNMFNFSDYKQGNGASGAKGKDDGISRHEFRIGLRLTGW